MQQIEAVINDNAPVDSVRPPNSTSAIFDIAYAPTAVGGIAIAFENGDVIWYADDQAWGVRGRWSLPSRTPTQLVWLDDPPHSLVGWSSYELWGFEGNAPIQLPAGSGQLLDVVSQKSHLLTYSQQDKFRRLVPAATGWKAEPGGSPSDVERGTLTSGDGLLAFVSNGDLVFYGVKAETIGGERPWTQVAIAPSGTLMVACDIANQIEVRTITHGVLSKAASVSSKISAAVRTIEWSLDERNIALWTDNLEVEVRDSGTLQQTQHFRSSVRPRFHPIQSLVVGADEQQYELQRFALAQSSSRTFVYTQNANVVLPSFLMVGPGDLTRGDRIVLFGNEGDVIKPLGIYTVASGRRNPDQPRVQANCTLAVPFPSLPLEPLKNAQRELGAISNSTSQRDTRKMNIHDRLVAILTKLYSADTKIVRAIRRELGGAPGQDKERPSELPGREMTEVLAVEFNQAVQRAQASMPWRALLRALVNGPMRREQLVKETVLSEETVLRTLEALEASTLVTASKVGANRDWTLTNLGKRVADVIGDAPGDDDGDPRAVGNPEEQPRQPQQWSTVEFSDAVRHVERDQHWQLIMRFLESGPQSIERIVQSAELDRTDVSKALQEMQVRALVTTRAGFTGESLFALTAMGKRVMEVVGDGTSSMVPGGDLHTTLTTLDHQQPQQQQRKIETAEVTDEPIEPSNVTFTGPVTIASQGPAPEKVLRIEVSSQTIDAHWDGQVFRGKVVGNLRDVIASAQPGTGLYAALADAPPVDIGAPSPPGDAIRDALDHDVRVLLDIQEADLQRLPWEAMTGAFGTLGTNEARPVARWINGAAREPARMPLRIVCAIANPTGLGAGAGMFAALKPIDRSGERSRFDAAIEPFRKHGATVELVAATRDELIKQIANGPHILHIVAHGLWNSAKNDYGLVLEDNDGKIDVCYLNEDKGERPGLVSILAGSKEIRLVLLGCCYSGQFAKDGNVSLGARLAQVVPAVIAMQDAITPDGVGVFAKAFYAGLARTGEADRAAAIGRLAMQQLLAHADTQWTIPAVYLGTNTPTTIRPVFTTTEDVRRAGRAVEVQMHQNPHHEAPSVGAGISNVGNANIGGAPGAPLAAARGVKQDRASIAERISRPVALDEQWLIDRIGTSGDRLVLDNDVVHQTIAALETGKHIIFIGPPGTGKTTLTAVIAESALRFSTGVLNATASADWSTADTVGALLPSGGGVQFRPGVVMRALLEGQWLVIDEINRAEIDKAFGELFSILSNQAVTLPFGNDAVIRVRPPHGDWARTARSLSGGDDWKPEAWCPADVSDDDIVVHPNFRILGTMNVYDRSFLFSMSLAFMRRFAFIDVGLPNNYDTLITQWLMRTDAHQRGMFGDELDDETRGKLGEKLIAMVTPGGPCKTLYTHRALGPAILRDVIAYVASRLKRTAPWLQALGEGVTLYVVPQLDGLPPEAVQGIALELRTLLMDPDSKREPLVTARLRALYPHVELI